MAVDTLARMFWDRVERSGDRPAQQFKHGVDWKTITWREVGDVVREVALGLLALGRSKGDAVALLSTSRAEWVQADFAIFSAGCITVPVYPTYPPDLIAYVVNDSGARTIIVEDPGQLAKVLEVRDKAGARAHHRDDGLRGHTAAQDGADVGDAAPRRPRQRRQARRHAGGAPGRDQARRSRVD